MQIIKLDGLMSVEQVEILLSTNSHFFKVFALTKLIKLNQIKISHFTKDLSLGLSLHWFA